MNDHRQCRQMSKKTSSFSTPRLSGISASHEISRCLADGNSSVRLAQVVLLSMARMFKISTIDTPAERRLVVEGTLIRPWVTELRKTWIDSGDSLDGRRMVIDLTNATVIDCEGEAAIYELIQDGAQFCCSGVLNMHVLERQAEKCRMPLHNVLKQTRSKHR